MTQFIIHIADHTAYEGEMKSSIRNVGPFSDEHVAQQWRDRFLDEVQRRGGTINSPYRGDRSGVVAHIRPILTPTVLDDYATEFAKSSRTWSLS